MQLLLKFVRYIYDHNILRSLIKSVVEHYSTQVLKVIMIIIWE